MLYSIKGDYTGVDSLSRQKIIAEKLITRRVHVGCRHRSFDLPISIVGSQEIGKYPGFHV